MKESDTHKTYTNAPYSVIVHETDEFIYKGHAKIGTSLNSHEWKIIRVAKNLASQFYGDLSLIGEFPDGDDRFIHQWNEHEKLHYKVKS